MRYHPQSRTPEREEIDVDHHLIHISDFVDIILPKLVNNEYQAADEQYLLKCFKKLDQNNKNYLHKKLFVQTMSTMEDALDENEADDLGNFLTKYESLSIENLQDFFGYKRYIKHLLPQRHRVYLDLGVAK
jgi:Ca2+-binding EF-hand superfamily protein